MGALAETALFAQWFHDPRVLEHLCYARWKGGEIDFVGLNALTQKPMDATEVKWSDRPAKDSSLLRHLAFFRAKHPALKRITVTTRTLYDVGRLPDGFPVQFMPTSLAVYEVGRFLLEKKRECLSAFGRTDLFATPAPRSKGASRKST